MKLFFLRDVKAGFAPGGLFKKGSSYDVAPNNLSTMLDNGFAVPEEQKPEIEVEKPVRRKTRKRK